VLQPTRVFNDEITRQNRMRWLSGYCFRRTNAMLAALKSCGHADDDPRVDALWPSTVEGESRNITIPSSRFQSHLDDAIDTIQTNSLLHVCSAFESALDGMYSFALLYRPSIADAKWSGAAVPQALSSPTAMARLKSLVDTTVSENPGKLKGNYSKRLGVLCKKFGLKAAPHASQLDTYYHHRHIVAHDQSLSQASNPLLSYKDIIQSRMTISDGVWRTMLSEFQQCVRHLDEEFRSSVVTDGGLSVAIYQTVAVHAPITIGRLRARVSSDWGIDKSDQEVFVAVQSLGFTVSTEKRVQKRTVKK
jgi:hypothetical protein